MTGEGLGRAGQLDDEPVEALLSAAGLVEVLEDSVDEDDPDPEDDVEVSEVDEVSEVVLEDPVVLLEPPRASFL